MRILILCTGNSCRSQMAHGLLQSFDSKLEVFSAGTKPAEKVNPMAVKVMTEIGIDLAQHTPKSVNLYVQLFCNRKPFPCIICNPYQHQHNRNFNQHTYHRSQCSPGL